MPYVIEPVRVQLDVDRWLRFDNAAIHAAERQWKSMGEPANCLSRFLQAVGTVQADTPLFSLDVSMTDWSVLCWACVQHELAVNYDTFMQLVPMGLVLSARAEILTAVLTGLYPPKESDVAARQAQAATEVQDADPLGTLPTGDATGHGPGMTAD